LNRDALSRAESSHSGIPEFQDEFGELTWEKLFPPEEFARFDEELGAWLLVVPKSGSVRFLGL
jgi:hypothetical protein